MSENNNLVLPYSVTNSMNLYLDFIPKNNLYKNVCFEFYKYEIWSCEKIKINKCIQIIPPACDTEQNLHLAECNFPEKSISLEGTEEVKNIILPSSKFNSRHSLGKPHSLKKGKKVKELSQTNKIRTQIPEKSNANTQKYNFDMLDINCLLEIKYKPKKNDQLQHMFQPSGNSIACYMCGCSIKRSKPEIIRHILGKKHSNQLNHEVVKIFHPAISKAKINCCIDMYTTFMDLCNFLAGSPSNYTQQDAKHSAKLDIITTGQKQAEPKIPPHTDENFAKKAKKKKEIMKVKKNCIKKGLLEKENLKPGNLSLDEFKQKYINMTIAHLLQIKYRFESLEWKFMISKNESQFICNLCGKLPLANGNSIKEHLESASHSKIMQEIVQINYPINYVSSPKLKPAPTNSTNKIKNSEATQKGKNRQETTKLEEFIKTYIKMKRKTILEIQYKELSGAWRHMLMVKDGDYYCNLCGGAELGKSYNVKPHITRKPHVKNIFSVENLYHPTGFPDSYSSFPKPLSESFEEYVNGSRLSMSFKTEKEAGLDVKIGIPKSSQENDSNNKIADILSANEKLMQTPGLKAFKLSYMNLPADELLKLEYKKTPSSDWSLMIHENPVQYRCNLCCRKKLKEKEDVMSHLNSSCHVLNMKSVRALYNPRHYLLQKKYLNNLDKSKSLEFTVEDRLEEFKVKYAEMKLQDILKVQFKTSDNTWQYLIELEEIRYLCILCCRISLKRKSDICSHITTSSHCANIKTVTALHHPAYFPSKDTQKESNSVGMESTESPDSIHEDSKTTGVINGVLKLISDHEENCKNEHCDLNCALADIKAREN